MTNNNERYPAEEKFVCHICAGIQGDVLKFFAPDKLRQIDTLLATQAKDRGWLETCKAIFETFIEQFPNPEVNHEDYRIQVMKISTDIQADIEKYFASERLKEGA